MFKTSNKKQIIVSFICLIVFVFFIPFFIKLGGGPWVLAEALPGEANISVTSLFSNKIKDDHYKLLNIEDIEFQKKKTELGKKTVIDVNEDFLNKINDFNFLKSNFYTIDKRTILIESDISAKEALAVDFSLDTSKKEAKILIFHTHAHEEYSNSDMSKGLDEGICGVGAELKRILEEDYGIGVYHHKGQYDIVDGRGQITGAYERIEPDIRKILRDNPSIEVLIDLHNTE